MISSYHKFRKASILIIALWSIFLLATFAVILSYTVRQKLFLAQRLEERDRCRYILEASLKKAIIYVKRTKSVTYVSLKSSGRTQSLFFKENECAMADDDSYSKHTKELGTARMESFCGIFDEERKININMASKHILERFFEIVLGSDELEAQELAAAIVDWRDKDSFLSIPLGSAEDSYYRGLAYPYEAKDGKIQALEELFLVKGISQDTFERIKNYLTIYGDGRININTTSNAVLLSLGLGEDTVDKIMLFRYGEDGILGTSDDSSFDEASGIVSKFSQSQHLNQQELDLLNACVDQHLKTSSNYFTVKAFVVRNGKLSIAEAMCVVNRAGDILRWSEL